MTDISSFFELNLGSDPWADRLEESVAEANQKLAAVVQRRIRQEVDFGIDKGLALKAQSVRVRAEGDRLVIDTKSQDEVLGDGNNGNNGNSKEESAVDLFSMGSGIPEVGSDGNLVYRKVSLNSLFQDQQDEIRAKQVEKIASSTAQMHMGSIVEESLAEVDRRHLGR